MGRARIFHIVSCLGLALAFAACDNPNPGTPLGTFAVTSALTANSCGAEVADTDPGSFQVTISNEQGIVYWFPDTGGTSVSGSMSASRTVSISEVVADDVDQSDAGAGACTLQRNDTLAFTLAAGASPASFTGSYSFTVSPAIGASCSDQLLSGGGGYTTLPCTMTYSLSGTRQ
jgi:hypothetical protein